LIGDHTLAQAYDWSTHTFNVLPLNTASVRKKNTKFNCKVNKKDKE